MTHSSTQKTSILVWDAPTRVFHWLLALCFAGAYLTAESERLMGVHLTLGYTMAGLVAFRLVWGLVGTRYARFSEFVRGPKNVARYASSLLTPKSSYPVGHNPLGALAIVLMLLSVLAIVGTGWVFYNNGVHSMKELHEGTAAVMLILVAAHVAGVAFASLMQRENLPLSMLNGHKSGLPDERIGWSWWPVAVLVLAGVLGFWWLQWQNPNLEPNAGQPTAGQLWRGHDGDDD